MGFVVPQVDVVKNCCILAAVGQRMASTPGVSATLFTALAKVRVNALERNLICCTLIYLIGEFCKSQEIGCLVSVRLANVGCIACL